MYLGSMYLYIKILVDFHHVPEQEDVLHQACKLPHTAQLCECCDIFRRNLSLRRIQLGLQGSAFVPGHSVCCQWEPVSYSYSVLYGGLLLRISVLDRNAWCMVK